MDRQLSKSEFIKAKKSFPDQQDFDENSTKRGERNHRNYQERTSKLKYKHSELKEQHSKILKSDSRDCPNIP